MTDTSTTPPAPEGLTADPSHGAGRLPYQPALDGLRAVSIVLVLLFHYSWNRLSPTGGRSILAGGFLGVDAFFVLSGFLITTLLLQEWSRHGRISLRSFYARRALRLLPLAAVLCTFALVLNLVLDPSDGARPERQGILGTAFYFANWMRIWRPGSMGVLGHAWSLSIEEQFYLVWPIVLVALLAIGARGRATTAFTATAIVSAAAWRVAIWSDRLRRPSHSLTDYYLTMTGRPPAGSNAYLYLADRWDRVYFGSDTRADALLAGCLLAVAIHFGASRLDAGARRAIGWSAVAGAAAFALIVARARIFQSAWLLDWGLLAFEAAVLLVIVGVLLGPRSPLARALSTAPLVWIGRRSYGIYIVHWPVFMLLNREHLDIPEWPSLLLQMAVVLVVADLSFRYMERPVLALKDRFQPAAGESRPR